VSKPGTQGRPGLPFHIKLFFGVGQIAEGLKNRTFETFLFFYYVQVLGLSPGLAGLAMLIAVISDAVTDPLVGTLTDGHRSRMGRRHPFMYGAAIPLGLLFILMFNPPDSLGEQGLFAWLTVGSVLARTALSFYHVPHMALGAEGTRPYKPQPGAYLESARMLGLAPEQCCMVAAHNSDLVAAEALGLATAFVPRPTEYGPDQDFDLVAENDYTYVATDFIDLAEQLEG